MPRRLARPQRRGDGPPAPAAASPAEQPAPRRTRPTPLASLAIELPRLRQQFESNVARFILSVSGNGVDGPRGAKLAGAPFFAAASTKLSTPKKGSATSIDKKGSKNVTASDGDIEAMFKTFDKDGSGAIDRVELQAACGKLGLPSSDDYIDELISQYDDDGSKTVSLGEFKQFVKKKEKALWKAFQEIDADKNGVLTADEALKAVRKLGLQADEKDASQMIKLLDANKDGVVTYEEFKAYLTLLPAAQLRSNATWDWLASSSDHTVAAPANQPFKQLLAGALGGSLSRTATAPLDRSIMMIQADTGKLSLPGAVSKIVGAEGPLGLWRGNTPNVIKVIPRSAIQFTVFDNVKDFLLMRHKPGDDAGLNVAERFAAGSAAGACATMVTYPLDLTRSRMAVNGTTFTDTAKSVLKASGPLGFYKGLQPTLLTDIIANGLGFFLFDSFTEKYREVFKRKPTSFHSGLLGAAAAVTCLTMTFPLEVCMTRMRVQGSGGRPVLYKNVVDCLSKVAQEEGVKSLWKGAGPAYVKVFPMVCIVYFTVAASKKALGVGGLKTYDNFEAQHNK